MTAVAGVAMLVGAFALMRSLSGRRERPAERAAWVDVSAALVVTAAVGGGVALVVAGAVRFLSF